MKILYFFNIFYIILLYYNCDFGNGKGGIVVLLILVRYHSPKGKKKGQKRHNGIRTVWNLFESTDSTFITNWIINLNLKFMICFCFVQSSKWCLLYIYMRMLFCWECECTVLYYCICMHIYINVIFYTNLLYIYSIFM